MRRALGTPCRETLRLGDRKNVQAFHPLDGTPSLLAHPARALRALVLWGLLARNAARPLLSLRDISPTLWGNLPTPLRKLLKKLEQNF